MMLRTRSFFVPSLLPLFVSLSLLACGASSANEAASAPPPAEEVPDAGATPDAEAKVPNELADAVDALFAAAEAKDTFSGSVIVVDGGKIVLEKGYGLADRATKRKVAPDTLFRIGSISKQFTATAVLALAQDGKLALTDPVAKYFPDYPKENLAQDGTEVTLHHLLSHTSGLPDPRATTELGKIAWRREIAPSEQVDLVKGMPLVAKPGSAYAYLNYNFLLAAMIVEKVSGQSFEAFMKARFFDPLAMKDTGTRLPAADAGRAAVGYYDAAGELAAFTDSPTFKDPDVTLAFGSGQIYSTVQDLARWDRALLGEKVLGASTRELLFKPNLGNYGYGWVVQKKGDVSFAWHNGALSPLGFTALAVRVPSKDRFVAYLANRDLELVQPLFETKITTLAVK